MQGWFKTHRQISTHWIWKDPIKLKWWLTILIEVSYVDSKMMLGNSIIKIKAGQSANSLRRWSLLFECGTKAVSNFFTMLESDGMIGKKTIGKGKHSTTLVTITNWGVYQGSEETQGTTLIATQGKRKGHTLEEGKESKERKKLLGVRFEKWFKFYGVNSSKETANKVFLKMTDEDLELLTIHTPKFVNVTDVKFRNNPYKYLNQKMYKDEVIDRRDKSDIKLKPTFDE